MAFSQLRTSSGLELFTFTAGTAMTASATPPGERIIRNVNSPAEVASSAMTAARANNLAERSATGVGNVNGGDVDINGNRQLHPHSSTGDLVLVVGRDMTMRGTADIHGVILAREQVSIGGTPGANNAIVSSSPCNSPGSPNSQNEIFGSGSVTYNGGLQAPNYGVGSGNPTVAIDRWSEL